MSDKRIDDVTPDTNVTGVERFPVSDAGTAKYVTIDQVKAFVLNAIAGLSDGDVTSSSVFFHTRGGNNFKSSLSGVVAAVLEMAYGASATSAPASAKFLVNDGTNDRTLTMSALCTFLRENGDLFDLSGLSVSGVPASGDLMLIRNGNAEKKITFSNLLLAINGSLKDYIQSLTAAQNLTGSDTLYIINGSEAKKCTLSQIMAQIGSGDVIAPATHTPGNIPAWDNVNKKLTSGYGVASQISAAPSSEKLATEAAVSGVVSNKVDKVSGKGLSTNDYTTEEKTKLAGLSNAPAMTGASAQTDGASGLVPKPFVADREKYLRGDGTWSVPPSATVADMTGATDQTNGVHGLVPAPLIADKEKFLKGDGTWGTPTGASVADMTGATSEANGVHGLVPAPLIADKDKFLKGDGTWGVVSTKDPYSIIMEHDPVFSTETFELAPGESVLVQIKPAATSFEFDFDVDVPTSGAALYTFPISYVNAGASGFTVSAKINGVTSPIVALPSGVASLAALFDGTFGVVMARVMVDSNGTERGVSFFREAVFTQGS